MTAWHRTLGRPAAVIALLAVATKACQAAAWILLAHRFGAGADTDAYLIAKSVPVGLYLILDSLLYNSLVPLYRRADAPQPVMGSFVADVALGSLAIGIVLTLAVELAAHPLFALLAPGLTEAAVDQATALGRAAALAVAIAAPFSFLKAINACHKRYALAALDALVINVVLVGALLVSPTSWGLWPAAWALPIAFGLLWVIQAGAASGEMRFARPAMRNPLLRQWLGLLAPLLVLNVLLQANAVAMNALASLAGNGSVSALNYSYVMAQIPVSIAELVLFSAVFPFASALSKQDAWDAFTDSYIGMGRLLLTALTPIAAWIILNRTQLVQVGFKHGQFDQQAATLTALCLAGHGLAIIPWTYEAFAYRFLFAMKAHRNYVYIALARVGINLVLGASLVPWLGPLGIALAFAASFLAGAVLSAYAVTRGLGPAQRPSPVFNRSTAFLAVGAAGVVAGADWLVRAAAPLTHLTLTGAITLVVTGLAVRATLRVRWAPERTPG